MKDNDVVLWGIHDGRTGDADTLSSTTSSLIPATKGYYP
jgi:hypothetical protein